MRQLFFIITLMMSITTFAQTSDEGRISIQAMMPDDVIPMEASKNLTTRMQRMLVSNGYGDNGYVERFVLTAKVDITSKDIVPSTPARVSEKMEVTFFVGDVIENKLYASCTLSLQGIGTNENKAMISAFSKLNPNHKDFGEMLEKAKSKFRIHRPGTQQKSQENRSKNKAKANSNRSKQQPCRVNTTWLLHIRFVSPL